MAGAAGMTPLRLQPDFQRLKQEIASLERWYFNNRSEENKNALEAKLGEFYAYIKAHKEKAAGNDTDRPN